LGEHLYGAVGSVSGTSVDAGQDISGAEVETESVRALRLRLENNRAEREKFEAESAARREELKLKERESGG